MLGWLKNKLRPIEVRSGAASYTSQAMAARETYISGRAGVAELTATVQSCISLWEGGFAMADVSGTDVLPRHLMGLMGRSLALRGEALFYLHESGAVPISEWEVSTRMGKPRAYRISIPDTLGGHYQTVLAEEVLHVKVGANAAAPWSGTSPLQRSSLTGAMLHAVEAALAETFENAPLGSQIVPLPDTGSEDMASMRSAFRGRRGSTLVIEGIAQATAAGMNPQIGQKPDQLSPDLSKSMTAETLAAARESIALAYGVLPSMGNRAATGPAVREAQRQLAIWTLQPIAELLAEEASQKLGVKVAVDTIRPLQAFDAGGRARAVATIIKAMGEAKSMEIPADAFSAALHMVDWRD